MIMCTNVGIAVDERKNKQLEGATFFLHILLFYLVQSFFLKYSAFIRSNRHIMSSKKDQVISSRIFKT